MNEHLRRACGPIALAAALVMPTAATAGDIWFAPQDPVAAKQLSPPDYMDLFAPDAPWPRSLARLSVFKVSAQFVLSGTDDTLRTVFDAMRRRHVKMAVEMGTVVRLDACGLGEGYAPVGMSAQIGKRLHDLNLGLDNIAADEPVWYAHEVTWGTAKAGKPNCMYPLDVVADRVAMSVRAMRAYFPQIEIGDVDVVASDRTPPARLVADYAEFARLLQTRIGRKLAFFHADIAWSSDPLAMIAPLKRAMNEQGIPFGAIVGGSPQQTTASEWVRVGLARLTSLASDPATRPDQAIVQSWQKLPTAVLPETDPATETFMLSRAEDTLGAPLRKRDPPGA